MKRKNSFGARAVSHGMRLLVRISTKLKGESIMRTNMYSQQKPYKFGSWKAPEGYTNKKIELENSRGYLLQKIGKDHKNIIYQIHGGGFVGTFSNLYNNTALHFSKISGDSDVFSIDYRTAPKNLYPSALKDVIDGYHWLLKNGYEPKNILICGESAGGGLCLALSLYLRDHNELLPKGLVLSSPWTDMTASGESYMTKKSVDAFFGHPNPKFVPKYPVPIIYAGENNLEDPYLSPVYGNYSNFPPMLIQTGEAELLLSDSDVVVKKAKDAGVKVDYYTYPGMYHTFYIVTPTFRESKIAWKRIEEWLLKLK